MAAVAVLVYDGDCGFCTSSARWLRRRAAGRVEVAPWQQADLAALGLAAEQCASAVQLIGASGRFSGGAAVAEALRRCPQPWRAAGAVIAWAPLDPAVERVYRWVAAHRHRLPGATCAVPASVAVPLHTPASHGDERPSTRVDGQGARPAVAPADR